MGGVTPQLDVEDDLDSDISIRVQLLQQLSSKYNENTKLMNEISNTLNEQRDIVKQLHNTLSNLVTEIESVKTFLDQAAYPHQAAFKQDIDIVKEAAKLDFFKPLSGAWCPGQFFVTEDHQNQNQSSLRKTSGTDDSQLTSAKPMTGSLITSQNTLVLNELSDASPSSD